MWELDVRLGGGQLEVSVDGMLVDGMLVDVRISFSFIPFIPQSKVDMTASFVQMVALSGFPLPDHSNQGAWCSVRDVCKRLHGLGG
jgi:hypothetical protein